MKKSILAVLLSFGCTLTAWAQSKSSVADLKASVAMSINEEKKSTESQLMVGLTIVQIQHAAKLSVALRSTVTGANELSAEYEVWQESGKFYLLDANKRIGVLNGKAMIFIPLLTEDPLAYANKYAVVTITDKEGHVSPVQSVIIH